MQAYFGLCAYSLCLNFFWGLFGGLFWGTFWANFWGDPWRNLRKILLRILRLGEPGDTRGHPRATRRDTRGTPDGTPGDTRGPPPHTSRRRRAGDGGGGRRRSICLDFALATEGSFLSPAHAASPRPHARTNETKRFPGWGHSVLTPPTSN